ncbi:RNA polymerase sigma factor [Chitinophaga sp. 22321]|uniref:Sigma-70 family RNA polymerase sigma factor n=1 Tax=Chitinophaga hostae TaxID=2831022 RepID=A0ABS5J263_9BACT|nr:sigma-70 family RNA polymerase sigma factor [Chitinophaga hostae]MBS0029235.1 sigma-70 family RNA polymerase sigma factor [Chitinophaga hostae]
MPVKIDVSFDEAALWKRFKAGDKAAFTLIYRNYTVYLFQYGFRFCSDHEKLKDMVHDLFIELWNSRDTISDNVAIRFYLCRSLKYKLIRANYQYRAATGQQDKYLHNNSQVESTVEERIIDSEISDSRSILLHNAIKKLSRRQQEIITLRFYMGFTNAQIAEMMHMKYQSVSNLLYSALGRIKDTLETTPFARRLLETFYFFL